MGSNLNPIHYNMSLGKINLVPKLVQQVNVKSLGESVPENMSDMA